MNALLIILDGVGGLRSDKGTALEEANKPNIDELANEGSLGLMHVIDRGIVPGSDTGHLAIFGYDPFKDYHGRGPFEALGAGLELKHGDIAFRANFATVKGGVVVDRRAGRIETSEAKKLEPLIDGIKIDGVKVIFKSTTEHRGVLVLRGENLSPDVSDTDPHKTGVPPLKAKPLSNKAEFTANIINKLSKIIAKKLEGEKANYLLLRGAGIMHSVKPFKEKYDLKAAAIAGGALYKGVARYVGMEVLEVEGATGDKHSNFKAKFEKAKEVSKDYDFVFLHVKATDSFGHDGDLEGKKSIIEKIDRLIPIVKDVFDLIIITGDHSTPCIYKEHSGHPVPILAYGKYVRKDKAKKFDEFEAMKGGLGHIKGKDLMPLILNWIKKQKKFGS